MLVPTIGNVIVKIDAAPEYFENGLVRPDQAKDVQDTATVVAVSEGQRATNGAIIPHGIDVGDKILFEVKYAGAEVLHEGERLVVVPVSQIAAVLA